MKKDDLSMESVENNKIDTTACLQQCGSMSENKLCSSASIKNFNKGENLLDCTPALRRRRQVNKNLKNTSELNLMYYWPMTCESELNLKLQARGIPSYLIEKKADSFEQESSDNNSEISEVQKYTVTTVGPPPPPNDELPLIIENNARWGTREKYPITIKNKFFSF